MLQMRVTGRRREYASERAMTPTHGRYISYIRLAPSKTDSRRSAAAVLIVVPRLTGRHARRPDVCEMRTDPLADRSPRIRNVQFASETL